MNQPSLDPAATISPHVIDASLDRRLLGRLLGEVVQEQLGQATLDLIEHVRQTAVRFRRAEAGAGDADEVAAISCRTGRCTKPNWDSSISVASSV